MKKKTKMLSAVAAAVIIVSAAVVVLYLQMPTEPNYLPSGEPPAGQLRITGEVSSEENLSLEELSQMPLTNVTVVVDYANVTYWGVPLYDFCNQTGVLWDAENITFISADGNQATLNIFQAYNSSAYPYNYNRNVIMLALAKDGKWLTAETGGPVKLVAPYFPAEDQVENVAEIRFDPWTISISGKVAEPLTFTAYNLTFVESRTVEAEFAASEKRTSNWTGLPIMDVLQAANVSDRAEKVCVVAIDGYEKNFTLQQIEEGQMLIGYEENGNHLAHSEGGPFRLFAPTEQYKWAQNWVKFIHEIKV
jgi:DMSO/TMAO reductase YedYZ molybdopterin-dependent catalytic subunit